MNEKYRRCSRLRHMRYTFRHKLRPVYTERLRLPLAPMMDKNAFCNELYTKTQTLYVNRPLKVHLHRAIANMNAPKTCFVPWKTAFLAGWCKHQTENNRTPFPSDVAFAFVITQCKHGLTLLINYFYRFWILSNLSFTFIKGNNGLLFHRDPYKYPYWETLH